MFTSLTLENFTVFNHVTFSWSPAVNVLVGGNGTGKTHVMKVLYALQLWGHDPDRLATKLVSIFRPREGKLERLVRADAKEARLTVKEGDGQSVRVRFNPLRIEGSWEINRTAVYVPVKEMLSFAPGFISLYDTYALSVEEIYYDILKQVCLPARREMPLPDAEPVVEELRRAIGGQVSFRENAFGFEREGEEESLEMGLVSEGHKKLALIAQLIANGSLREGSCLYWDEPEANLNPALVGVVARVLLMLAKRGVQIFTVTHNYAFLRELDFQHQEIEVRYFALENEGKGVVSYPSDSYRNLSPNRIADEYRRLYDMEIMRSLGGKPTPGGDAAL